MKTVLAALVGAALMGFPVRVLVRANASSAAAPAGRASAQVGMASWYGEDLAGSPTASGEPFDPNALTAASLILPLGAWIRVTNLGNQRSVVLRVNDRGPNVKGRILDVSEGAARRLGFHGAGLATVRIVRLRHRQKSAENKTRELSRAKTLAPGSKTSADEAALRTAVEAAETPSERR